MATLVTSDILSDSDFMAAARIGEFTLRGELRWDKEILEFDGRKAVYAAIRLLHPDTEAQASWSIRIPASRWVQIVKELDGSDLSSGNWVCSRRIHYREDGEPDTFTSPSGEVRFRYDYNLAPAEL